MMQRAWSVVRRADPEALEVFLGLWLGLWGLWTVLLGSGELEGPALKLLALCLGGPRSISLVSLGLGVLLAMGGLFRYNTYLRMVTDVFCAAFYAALATSTAAWSMAATAVPVSVLLMLSHCWLAWRAFLRGREVSHGG